MIISVGARRNVSRECGGGIMSLKEIWASTWIANDTVSTVRENMKRVGECVEPVEPMGKKVKGKKCMHNHHPSEPPGTAHDPLY